MRNVLYLRARDRGDFPEYAIPAFERALSRAGMGCVANEPVEAISHLGKVLARLGLVRQIKALPLLAFFAPMMGPTERRFWPASYFSEVIPYCYDCWPKDYDRWQGIFTRNRVRLAFFSAQQSAEYFAERLPNMEAVWLCEATDPSDYRCDKPLAERRIDVLEMGRRYRVYHSLLRQPLREAGLVHMFERMPGAVVFQTRRDFIGGLADTKISICFPSSLTHPQRSGSVETLTHRYLESIASKCVLLGRCPHELEMVFGYSPVIEADVEDPVGQINDLVANIAQHEDAVERNYRRLLEIGTWEARVGTLLTTLADRGYSVRSRGRLAPKATALANHARSSLRPEAQ